MGSPILTGDSVEPGSLLQPGEGDSSHSITVLLPDGQRILYECFTTQDCARGFRVPSLYRTPEPLAVEMLARIHAVLADGKRNLSPESSTQQSSLLPRDEAVAVLGPDNRADVAGLAGKLSDGRYTYDLQQLDHAFPRQLHLAIEKKAPFITLVFPSSGLYDLTITDDLNTPRIDLFIAAVGPAKAASFKKSFQDAKALMDEWNSDYYGWPIHDFQRAYLESLMLSAKPPTPRLVNTAGKPASDAPAPDRLADTADERVGMTAEPSYFPKPGVFTGDTTVILRCNTQGATIHFTVDGSQPVASSAVYRAPIMVKGTELTIKSFASVAGRKDSAVVTGIFRIRQ
jgi:hypothetical protein